MHGKIAYEISTICYALRLLCSKLFVYHEYFSDFNIFSFQLQCICIYLLSMSLLHRIRFISVRQLQLQFESSTALSKTQPGFGFNVIRGNYARKSCSPFTRRNGCTQTRTQLHKQVTVKYKCMYIAQSHASSSLVDDSRFNTASTD